MVVRERRLVTTIGRKAIIQTMKNLLVLCIEFLGFYLHVNNVGNIVRYVSILICGKWKISQVAAHLNGRSSKREKKLPAFRDSRSAFSIKSDLRNINVLNLHKKCLI